MAGAESRSPSVVCLTSSVTLRCFEPSAETRKKMVARLAGTVRVDEPFIGRENLCGVLKIGRNGRMRRSKRSKGRSLRWCIMSISELLSDGRGGGNIGVVFFVRDRWSDAAWMG